MPTYDQPVTQVGVGYDLLAPLPARLGRMATERLTVVRIPGNGAEDVLIGPKGHVWTATEDGSVFRLTPDGHLVERVAHREPLVRRLREAPTRWSHRLLRREGEAHDRQ